MNPSSDSGDRNFFSRQKTRPVSASGGVDHQFSLINFPVLAEPEPEGTLGTVRSFTEMNRIYAICILSSHIHVRERGSYCTL